MSTEGDSKAPAESAQGTPYWRLARAQLGRALSRLDADPASPSRGCLDRTWWCWKFTDFAGSRFQEGVYALAFLLSSELVSRDVRESRRLLWLTESAIEFWTSLQHRDGSFDEAYPFERSLAATAFTSFYVGAALERVADRLSPAVREAAERALHSAASWLARNDERHGVLSNHLAAAAAALQVAGDHLGTGEFRAGAQRYLDVIWSEQDAEEGWLREYAGADPGYQSHALFYLAEIWRRTGDDAVLARLSSAAEFNAWFAHPDGTLGGEYSSRGTKFAFPAGFEILAARVPAAAAVAAHLRRSLEADRGVGLQQMDAWNLFPLLNNYLFAAEAAAPAMPKERLPWLEPGARRVFPNAGLVLVRCGEVVVAAAPGLGGALKAWTLDPEGNGSGALLYEDCGYVSWIGRAAVTSQTPSRWESLDAGRSPAALALEIRADFASLPSARMTPWRFVAFRIFSLTAGRAPGVARWLKSLLVKVLIHRRRRTAGRLIRRILVGEDSALVVEDRIEGLASEPRAVARQVPVHMGSARYGDLEDSLGAIETPPPVEWRGSTGTRKVRIECEGIVGRRARA